MGIKSLRDFFQGNNITHGRSNVVKWNEIFDRSQLKYSFITQLNTILFTFEYVILTLNLCILRPFKIFDTSQLKFSFITQLNTLLFTFEYVILTLNLCILRLFLGLILGYIYVLPPMPFVRSLRKKTFKWPPYSYKHAHTCTE